MKTRIFLLAEPTAFNDAPLEQAIAEVFSSTFPDGDAMRRFESVRSATAEIGQAFSDSDVVMFLVDEAIYAESKELLCKALGIRLQANEKLLQLAQRGASETEADTRDFAHCHAFLPRKAKAFALSDALYTGFAVIKGVQTAVILPWSAARTVSLISTQVIPYLNSLYSETLNPRPIQLCYAAALKETLTKAHVKATVAGNNTARLIVKYMDMIPGLRELIPVADRKAEARGHTLPQEYALNLSVTAAELMGLPYGIAMTNSYSTKEQPEIKTVYIAVTDENETAVRSVNSLYGEGNAEFMLRCCGELCRLIIERVASAADAAHANAAARKKKSRGGYIVRIVIVLLLTLLLAGGGVWYFGQHNYSLGMWVARYLPFLSQGISDGDLDAIPFEEANRTEAAEQESGAASEDASAAAASDAASADETRQSPSAAEGETQTAETEEESAAELL